MEFSLEQSWVDTVDIHQTCPLPSWASSAHVGSIEQYRAMYRESIEEPEAFWGRLAAEFHWQQPWSEVEAHHYDCSTGNVFVRWFSGGRTNLCYNALDRHVAAGHGDTVAYFWEGNEEGESSTITYAELLRQVCRFANVLKSLGIKKGDTVAVYMPMVVELCVVMLACARIGAIHSVIFAGFSSEALAARILDARSNVVIVADGNFRGTKFIDLKSIVDEALEYCGSQGFSPEHVVLLNHVGARYPNGGVKLVPGRDKSFSELIAAADDQCEVEWVDAEDPLFVLYTSGSTGKPKGVIHTTGGYMVWVSLTHKVTFDYHPGEIYWCTADIGWITGHSYILYGPLLNRATSVLFEGIPTHPDNSRYWQVCEKYKVNQFYTAPTAIRALKRLGDQWVTRCDLSSLRIIGSVGEPINPDAWNWYRRVVGKERCAVVDTWWQTETGGHMLTPLPGCTVTKPGSTTLPMFGVVPAVVDKDGNEIEGPCRGYLVIKRPWPGQMRTVFNDHQRFIDTYFAPFKGYYTTGDGCRRDEDGYYWITGRVDDVLNVSGHRIGTAEVESALVSHPGVAEAAVVSYPHEIKGEGIYAYVVLKPGVEFTEKLQVEMRNCVRHAVGAFAQPDLFQDATHGGLPKTRSGKIMRRILRKIAHKEADQLGDISTLSDPHCVEELIKNGPK